MVYEQTASRADDLVKAGAQFMEPIEMAKQADYLIMMLGYPKDVQRLALDPQVGILKHMRAGSTLIDHTTSSPALA